VLYGVRATSSSDAWTAGAYRNAANVYQTLVALEWHNLAAGRQPEHGSISAQHSQLGSSDIGIKRMGGRLYRQRLHRYWIPNPHPALNLDGTGWTDMTSP
jgi:hypothetical protein